MNDTRPLVLGRFRQISPPPHLDLRQAQHPVSAWRHPFRSARGLGAHCSSGHYATTCPTGMRQLDEFCTAHIHHPAPPALPTDLRRTFPLGSSHRRPLHLHQRQLTDHRHLPPRVRRRVRNITFVHAVSCPRQLGPLLGCPSPHRPLPDQHASPRRRFL